MTADYYGFIQVGGLATVLFNNDDDAADGDVCILGASDGVANTGSDPGVVSAYGIVVTAVTAATNLATVLLKRLI
jgi:hypothetical protein